MLLNLITLPCLPRLIYLPLSPRVDITIYVVTGAPAPARPRRQLKAAWETSLLAALQPWDARTVSDRALPGVLATLFGGDAQFATGNGA